MASIAELNKRIAATSQRTRKLVAKHGIKPKGKGYTAPKGNRAKAHSNLRKALDEYGRTRSKGHSGAKTAAKPKRMQGSAPKPNVTETKPAGSGKMHTRAPERRATPRSASGRTSPAERFETRAGVGVRRPSAYKGGTSKQVIAKRTGRTGSSRRSGRR